MKLSFKLSFTRVSCNHDDLGKGKIRSKDEEQGVRRDKLPLSLLYKKKVAPQKYHKVFSNQFEKLSFYLNPTQSSVQYSQLCNLENHSIFPGFFSNLLNFNISANQTLKFIAKSKI